MDNYKNKVSKYQNKLNQVGGSEYCDLPQDIIKLGLEYLILPDLINLYRTGNTEVKRCIQENKMYDFYDQEPLPRDVSLREFNEMFPFCNGLNISRRGDILDADFVYLRCIKRLKMNRKG